MEIAFTKKEIALCKMHAADDESVMANVGKFGDITPDPNENDVFDKFWYHKELLVLSNELQTLAYQLITNGGIWEVMDCVDLRHKVLEYTNNYNPWDDWYTSHGL